MVIDHFIETASESMKVDYTKHFSPSILKSKGIKDVLESEYMSNLMFYIYEVYASNDLVYPKNRDNLFRAYKTCKYDNLKVVIIGNEPFCNVYSNGYAFGRYSAENATIPNTIQNMIKAIKKSYDEEDRITFDTSLEKWVNQGVMMLNTSLISELAAINKHQKYFRNLIRETIKAISDDLVDIVFVFTDKMQSDYFKKYIDTQYHRIIEIDGFEPDSTVFEDINDKLTEELRVSPIKWI